MAALGRFVWGIPAIVHQLIDIQNRSMALWLRNTRPTMTLSDITEEYADFRIGCLT